MLLLAAATWRDKERRRETQMEQIGTNSTKEENTDVAAREGKGTLARSERSTEQGNGQQLHQGLSQWIVEAETGSAAMGEKK